LLAWAKQIVCVRFPTRSGCAMGKKKDKKDKKDKKKKEKKDKKKKEKEKDKKKKDKKSKKKASSSSSGSDSSGSDSSSSAPAAKKQKKEPKEVKESIVSEGPIVPVELKVDLDALPAPEEGIKRFIFQESETPLGVRFSAGFPPLILNLTPDGFSAKKGVPPNSEVHAVNGHALVPQNVDVVMAGLKKRPVALDVRPQGWKPKAVVKELERQRERAEAEKEAIARRELARREQLEKEAAERAEQERAERQVREAKEREEREILLAKAKEQRAIMKAKKEEFMRILNDDPEEERDAATNLMEAEYGSKVKLQGRRGIPLRLMTRRKEVAWIWLGEAQELIGGGVQDPPEDTWSEG